MKPVKVLDTEMKPSTWGYRLKSGVVTVQVSECTREKGVWFCQVWIRGVCLTPQAAMPLNKRWRAKTPQGAAMKATRLLEAVFGALGNLVLDRVTP